MPLPANKRNLPSKEATVFRELLTLYETRQLKKGQKAADQILKKFPEHGETICMKGLILTHLGKREEGLELVKKGIRLDLTSHICWHVFGLIQKGEKNYEEALKSYTQALRFDKENLNILRDTAHLQTQLRIYDGLVDTRHTLLKIRPQLRQNWVALAVAHHLNGDLPIAKKILENYETMLKNIPDYDVEHSEMLLYHIRVLEDLGDFSQALSLLDVSAKSRAIVDRTSIMEYRARILSKSNSNEEAENAWRALIEQNPDCYEYYRGFLSNQGIELDENRRQALDILITFSDQIPRATAPRRLALNIATGDEFKDIVEPYLLNALSKGIPSLFVDVKSLYRDSEKQHVIESVVEGLRERLAAEPLSSTSEPPTTYIWALYFLAQHHSFLSRYPVAISMLDTAIAHTPSLPELYLCKARALKRTGDYIGASVYLNDARLLDGQDRFLNTKCAKYRLRAGLVEEANEILGLFTKKDASSPGADLEDMQSLLYLTEEGDSHYRSGRLNLALKKYYAVNKVFDEMEDDQFDFHGYSMRKFTLNVYLDLIKWEDQLRLHPTYIHAVVSASRIWVAVYDDPTLASNSTSTGSLSESEKKAKRKAKKAQKTQEDSKKANATASNEDKGLEPPPAKDEDSEGIKLISATDPLERAAKLLAPLTILSTRNVDVALAIFDVALRRKKFLQAIKSLKLAHSIDAEHPELHIRAIEFRRLVISLQPPISAPVGPVLTDFLSSIIPEEVTLETYNSQYLQRHSNSAQAILACAKVSYKLISPQPEIESLLFTALNAEVNLDIKSLLAIMSFLEEIKSSRAEEFRSACAAKYERSTVFRSPEELATLRRECIAADAADGDKDKLEVIG
ncbi:hypothetical protein SERLA73DRAFT_101816 [Serpula lacrymans var. lacrymans S7.3]|uniref:N-terminal acetyltransferase A, auxiliary subunit n=1 Tax=Serpula lacrymans var. lacrymans (strain S7.3) TaxID=936435 RepID=F8PKP0_SERL3|nr:hypothetical protein SERLA73DRAFT_101816 [Serpula lacrymans var. lacrymans S7.3]